jgi:hypothetical protein
MGSSRSRCNTKRTARPSATSRASVAAWWQNGVTVTHDRQCGDVDYLLMFEHVAGAVREGLYPPLFAPYAKWHPL